MQKGKCKWARTAFGPTSFAVSFSFGLQQKGSGFALEVTNRKERGLVNGRLNWSLGGRLVFPSGLKSGVEAYNCAVTKYTRNVLLVGCQQIRGSREG